MIASLLLAAAAATAAPPTDERIVSGEIGARIDRWLTASGYTGAALVAKDGAIVFRAGYGEADREAHTPWRTGTVISIGSITKQFTAAAILKLEAQGKLKVEDPIAKYLPGVPEDKRAITIHQLLTHTSGLDGDFARDYDPVGRDEYVKRALASKLRTPPGKEHFYANAGYSLLGAIVEIVSGKPYEVYLRENLFLPAGMKETGYRLPAWDASRLPVGYQGKERWGRMTEKPWAADGPYWALRANGGIESTLDDMYRWAAALDSDAVLPAAEREKLFKPYVAEGPAGESFYGYGWSISTAPWGGREIGHNGGNGIFSADFRRFPDEKIVVIAASNVAGVKAWRAADALALLAHGDDVPVPKAEPATAKPLGTTGRHALARAWIDAYNTGDPAAMKAFLSAHSDPGSAKMSEEERMQRLKRIHDDLGTIAIEGVVDEDDESTTVRVSAARDKAKLRFLFTPGGKFAGLGIQIGE